MLRFAVTPFCHAYSVTLALSRLLCHAFTFSRNFFLNFVSFGATTNWQ